MPPPPLRPEKDSPPKAKPRNWGGKLHQLMELAAESGVSDVFTGIAAGVKAYREARRLRNGQEIHREPEDREI